MAKKQEVPKYCIRYELILKKFRDIDQKKAQLFEDFMNGQTCALINKIVYVHEWDIKRFENYWNNGVIKFKSKERKGISGVGEDWD